MKIYTGDALPILKTMDPEIIDCCVTSPPYWGLRDYGTGKWEGGDSSCDHRMPRSTNRQRPGDINSNNRGSDPIIWKICGKCGAVRKDKQLGLEKTPEEYVAKMVKIFREVRRLLKPTGTLWLNIGDSYCGSWGNYGGKNRGAGRQRAIVKGSQVDNPAHRGMASLRPPTTDAPGLKQKDLVGIPWMLAFALRSDGWYLRQDIIWHKPNPMPESVQDRCTKAHEYVFLLSKSDRYFFDSEAIAEPLAEASILRLSEPNLLNQKGSDRVPGKTNGPMKAVVKVPSNRHQGKRFDKSQGGGGDGFKGHSGNVLADGTTYSKRNKRSVWTITTKPFKKAHFATFPPELPMICIKAGCPEHGTVLDPFMGAGTTAVVAKKLGRDFVGIELNPVYVQMAEDRIGAECGTLF